MKVVSEVVTSLVNGYVRETFHEYAPDIVIYKISLFYTSKNMKPFNIYNQNGVKINININNITEVYGIGSSQYYISSDNTMYINGINFQGKFGIGNPGFAAKKKPINFKENESFRDISIQLMNTSCDSPHCIVYTYDNKLYGCGNNKCKQISFNSDETHAYKPILISDNLPFKSALIKIETGIHHTIFLAENGIAYGCGNNDKYQLSFDRTDIHYDITALYKFNNVSDISCIGYASYILINNGKLYSFGLNKYGYLGINNQNNTAFFNKKEIKFNGIIDSIQSGSKHVCFKSNDNKGYFWGYNVYYQCGTIFNGINEPQQRCLFEPKLLKFNQNIDTIQCGGHHNIIKTMNGDYYSFGDNKQNKCLIKEKVMKYGEPKLIDLEYLKNIIGNDNDICGFVPTLSDTFILQNL
mmetsp:Transcript_21971/g.27071  ORF Transcript_21971/g.27071 Transcript_21971/m.27071 type:complete len:411 (-) Transcript_21971:17-1249(-)